MDEEFTNGVPQSHFTEENHSVQAFVLHRTHEPFDMQAQIWRSRRQLHGLYTGLLQDRPERVGELRVAIHQQVLLASQKSIIGVAEIARDLDIQRS